MKLLKATVCFGLLSVASSYATATSDRQIKNSVDEMTDSLKAFEAGIKESNVRNSPSPIGIKGDFVARGYYNKMGKNAPKWTHSYDERSYLDGDFNLKFVVNPNPFFTLWSTVTFGYDFGNSGYINENGTYADGTRRVWENRNPQRENVGIFEELLAGADIRTKYLKVLARVGSALWIEQSPFTVWRRDPNRRLAWYYESYEPERRSESYYGQKSFTRNNFGGRSTWPRRTFGGFHLDFYSLPGGTYLEFLMAEANGSVKPSFPRGNQTSLYGDAEGLGTNGFQSKVWAAKLGNRRLISGFDLSYNFLKVRFNDEIINDAVVGVAGGKAKRFVNQFMKITENNAAGYLLENPFVIEPEVHSIDLRGNINTSWYFHGDIALSREIKRTWLPTRPITFASLDEDGNISNLADADQISIAPGKETIPYDLSSTIKSESSTPVPAAFFKVTGGRTSTHTIEGAYIHQDFNSPYSQTEYTLAIDKEHMKLGSGTFGFEENTAGLNYTFQPKLENGFLKLTIGEYVQLKEGADVVRFQHKLIGRDLWKSSFSWSKTDPTRPFTEGHAYNDYRQNGRLGALSDDDRFYGTNTQGGYIGDDLSLWEEFATYDGKTEVESAKRNFSPEEATTETTVTSTDSSGVERKFEDKVWAPGKVTVSRKFATSAAFDYGVNMAKWWGGKNSVFFNLYGEWNAVSKAINPFGNKTILHNSLIMAEPVFQLHDDFYLVATGGIELFKSGSGQTVLRNTYNNQGKTAVDEPVASAVLENTLLDVEEIAVDYQQWSAGIGFDWDFSKRAGLHFRYKFASHTDKALKSYNDKLEDDYAFLQKVREEKNSLDQKLTKDEEKLLGNYNNPDRTHKGINKESYTAHYFFLETKVWF